ncbi:MAG: SAF domain-containing protein, partial [Candidatus Omnitrophota bacterium]
AVRNTEKALGDGVKRPLPCELKNKPVVRKSIVAMKDITEGDIFSADNITVKRPASGITPMEWDNVIGRTAGRDFKKDEQIEL